MDRIKQVTQFQEALINQPDFLGGMLQSVLQEAIETEFLKFMGVNPYERTAERNGRQRNGSYERSLQTRVGSLKLSICRDRDGEFHPTLFERYQRSEKALVATIAQMYFNGVSTRKVKNIVEELCGFGISKSRVSDLVKDLDDQLLKWRDRELKEEYPYLLFDARYEKVRENNRVVSKAFVVIIGITSTGIREIIGCWVINSESAQDWDECIKSLKARGLRGVKYAVSDENAGLRNALTKNFQDILLQRCQVHYMRNFLVKLAKSDQAEGIRLLQAVFAAEKREDVDKRLIDLKSFLLNTKKNTVVDWLENTIEDTLVVLNLPLKFEILRKLRSTNMLERFNQELKRRSRVVRIFPDEQSCLRLLGTLCQETSESWANRKYLNLN
jgi:transposase-like protein